ncbi:MAG: hypothetical protein R2783_00660 [Gelidibacter sp.]
MAKKTFHKVFSLLMAFLVLFSTVTFTIEKHFCGDELIDLAMFSKANNCGTDVEAMKLTSVEKENCCKDEVEVVKGQDKLKLTSFEDLHLQQQLFITSFAYTYINLFEGLPQQVIPHKNYSPPNLVADIHVLDQVSLFD